MNDKMNLKEWLSLHSDQEEMRTMFYKLDYRMKYIHSRGYYVTKFNLDKIIFDPNSNMVDFLELDIMSSNNYQQTIDSNIYTMSCLEVASYANCLDFFNPKFLTEQFDEFAPFIPKDDVTYYRRVFQEKKYNYFSDYRNILEEEKNKKESNNSSSNTNTSTKQRSYVKSTSVGKIYQVEDNHLNNTAAFANVLLLSVFAIFITVVTLIGILLFKS